MDVSQCNCVEKQNSIQTRKSRPQRREIYNVYNILNEPRDDDCVSFPLLFSCFV